MRNGKRRSYTDKHPVDESLWKWVKGSHPILARLNPEELESLKELAVRFIRKKTFENPEGMTLGEEMKYSIAVQACLPVLYLGLEWYDNWHTVVVVPKSFRQQHQVRDAAGVVHEWSERDVGESWDKGPVVLSLEDVEDSGWCDGDNVVIHEAAHRLDLTDGEMNGRPELPRDLPAKRWFDVMSSAFADFSRRVEKGKRIRIDEYAAENDAEFFAVLTEYFFETPGVLLKSYPEVYELFSIFYRQDPAGTGNR